MIYANFFAFFLCIQAFFCTFAANLTTMNYKLLLFTLIFFASCNMPKPYDVQPQDNLYAQGFQIAKAQKYTEVNVYSPWQKGTILQTYYLVASDSIPTPPVGIKIKVPVQRLTLTSCTHIGFLKALNRLNCVYGICSPDIVYNREVFAPEDGHHVMNVGDAMTPDVERIVRTNPDAVMVSTYAQGDVATQKLNSLGLPVIYNNEWTETHPLARAEWIRFVGLFFGCEQQADSIFAEVVNAYNKLSSQALQRAERRTIMSGNNFRGTWYMPAGSTYMGVLFHDAGADYAFADDTSHFSIPLGIETVIQRFAQADVWVGCPAGSLAELKQMDEKHTWFKSYQNGDVYNFAKRTTPQGGNDFWETGVVHPEYILSDLIEALYPTGRKFYFTEHLK